TQAPLVFLHAEGRRIVDPEGRPVVLRGSNCGSWLAIEPWIIGWDLPVDLHYEKNLWDLVGRRFGEEEKLRLIKAFRSNFFTKEDVRRIAENGMNCLRIPVWWRAVSDPVYGGDIAYLDQCIQWCKENNVYAIIDLHGRPGGQYKWPCSGETNTPDYWKDERNCDAIVAWWAQIAARYRNEPAVAGYDLINEPEDAAASELAHAYDRLYKAIRMVDERHMLIMQDGLHGLHLLPQPARAGWTNVAYSIHYYPQTPLEGVEAEAKTFLKYNRAALYHGVPILVGEFNTLDTLHGGADSFRSYADAFDHFGWAWTFWSYKRIDNNLDSIWGLYGYADPVPTVNPETDPPEKFYEAFRRMRTERTGVQPFLQFALQQPARDFARILAAETPPEALMLSLNDAYILRASTGDNIHIEWGLPLPNVQYWSRGDRVAWPVAIPIEGCYELSLMLASMKPNNNVDVWVDGVRIFIGTIPKPVGSWKRYEMRRLGVLSLKAGQHIVELAHGKGDDPFINLRYALLKPVDEQPVERNEKAIRLDAVTMNIPSAGSPLRIEWMEDPSSIGYWNSGEEATWNLLLDKGGDCKPLITYGTPNTGTVLQILVDGLPAAKQLLPPTGDWRRFKTVSFPNIQLPAGHHVLTVVWQGSPSGGCGNLVEVLFERP
ncbi:MAG: cellulase family glycosylhydrolase, partial [Lentisphaerota bacterium]